MSSKSPFADIYDKFFVPSDPKSQEEFLRQLFTKHGAISSSYLSFILWMPLEHEIEHLKKQTRNKARLLQGKIVNYSWEELFDIDPVPENYDEDLMEWINTKFINNHLSKMEAHCHNGELLRGISEFRIIESGLNLDWGKVAEPASYYGEEVGLEIGYLFDHFATYFMDGIFCVEMIREGIKMIEEYLSAPGEYFDHSQLWKELIGVMQDSLDSQ